MFAGIDLIFDNQCKDIENMLILNIDYHFIRDFKAKGYRKSDQKWVNLKKSD